MFNINEGREDSSESDLVDIDEGHDLQEVAVEPEISHDGGQVDAEPGREMSEAEASPAMVRLTPNHAMG